MKQSKLSKKLQLLTTILLPLLIAFVALGIPQKAYAAPTPEPVPAPDNCYEANIYYGAIPPGGEDGDVLVFIHGYSGLAIDWWFFNFGSGFNAMYDLAYAAGYRTAFINTNVQSATGNCEVVRQPVHSVLDAGPVVAQQLDYITEHYNVDQVNIIAHSKGGIDAQSAIVFQGSNEQVANILTLSSPHQGEILADLVWSLIDIPGIGDLLEQLLAFITLDEGFRSLRENNMKVFRLYADVQEANEAISYYSAAGTGWEGSGGITSIGGAILNFLGYENDGIVTVDSTYLPYAFPFFVADYSHNEMYQGQYVFDYIQEVLTAAPSNVTITGQTTGAVNSVYEFTAAVSPITVTVPLTYSWQVTDQSPIVVSGGRENKASFSWTTAGIKAVTVTISNEHGSASQTFNVNIISPVNNLAPLAVTLQGANLVAVGQAQTFNAMVLPINSTQPLQYTWQATGLSQVIHSDGASDQVTFMWNSPGSKTVTVTATNNFGSASTNMTVNVGLPPTSVEITGVTVGKTGDSYNFFAFVNPDVTTPITYTWRTTDHDEVVQTSGNSHNISFNWENAGEQPIAVKAENAWGVVADYITVDIYQAPLTVTITHDPTTVVNTTHFFTATTDPETVTTPITYTWQSVGNPPTIVHTSGITDSAGISWATVGTKSVSVMADNQVGSASDNTTVSVIDDSPNTAPVSLAIAGITRGQTGFTYDFVATVSPLAASQPINYEWEINGDLVRDVNSGGNDLFSISWDEGGTYEITVTATNSFGTVSDNHTLQIIAPVTGGTFDWPAVLPIGELYQFSLTAAPLTATLPITYTWWTPDLGSTEIIHVGGITDTFLYAWSTPGGKALSVTLYNGLEEIVVSDYVEVIEPITTVSLAGPTNGETDISYLFTASVLPIDATTPVDYLWEATGYEPVIHYGTLTDNINLSWDTPGTKIVTVTATNGLESYTDSIEIEIAGTPPSSVIIDGPTNGTTQNNYQFTANVNPEATTPITYTWSATDQSPIIQVGELSNSVNFSWTTPGNKTVQVTASNSDGSVSDTFSINITSSAIPPTSAQLSGPTSGQTETNYSFTVETSPSTTTTPLTYLWEATDHPPVEQIGELTNTFSFLWHTTGEKTIAVTVSNEAGTVTTYWTIDISSPNTTFINYLPIILKGGTSNITLPSSKSDSMITLEPTTSLALPPDPNQWRGR